MTNRLDCKMTNQLGTTPATAKAEIELLKKIGSVTDFCR